MKSDNSIQGWKPLIAFLDLFLSDNESINTLNSPSILSLLSSLRSSANFFSRSMDENLRTGKLPENKEIHLTLSFLPDIKMLKYYNMYWGQVKEQWCKFSIISLWNNLSIIIISLSHATANLILPLTKVVHQEAKLNKSKDRKRWISYVGNSLS